MNLTHATATVDAATAILREDNDRAERVAYWRAEVQRMRLLAGSALPGVNTHCANIRLCQCEFALFKLTGRIV